MGRISIYTILLAFFVITLALIPSISGEEEEEKDIPGNNSIAILDTDYGIIKFVIYENWTPITSSHFIELAKAGHYDGVVFHRIVDDFVIQTGDGGGSDTIPLEIHPNATHVDGAVGMARSEDPDSAEDQFYICDGDQHGLDGDYAVFGLVLEGMEVVQEIAQVPVYGENNPRPGAVIPPIWHNVGMPKEDVYLNNVTIESPSENETNEVTSESEAGGGFPYAVLGALVVIAVLVVLVFFRGKIWG